MKNKDFVTSYGLFSTIVVTVVGIGIFSYPREVSSIVGTDAWIQTIIFGCISLLVLKIIWKVEEINNFTEFTVLVKNNFGKFVGKLILIIFSALQVIAIALSMRIFVEVIKMYLLEKTPTEFILITTIFCGTYLIRGGARSLINFNEISLGVMFIPLFIVLALLIGVGDYTNILPVLHNDPINYLKAFKYIAFSFGGMEITFFIIPLIKEKSKAKKILTRSIIFITFIYTLITIMVIAVFTKNQTSELMWPTITMIKSIDIPGTFIERWEGIVMALWILFYFTTFINSYYFSCHVLKEIFHLGHAKVSTVIIVPFLYFIAMYPKNISELFYLGDRVIPFIFIFNLVFLPIFLVVTGSFRTKNKKEGYK